MSKFNVGDYVKYVDADAESNIGITGTVIEVIPPDFSNEGRIRVEVETVPKNSTFCKGRILRNRVSRFVLTDKPLTFEDIRKGDKIRTVLRNTDTGTERTQVATVFEAGHYRVEDRTGMALAFRNMDAVAWHEQEIYLLDRPVPAFDAAKYGTGSVVTIDAVKGTGVKVYAATWTVVDGATATFYTDAEFSALGTNRDAYTVVHAQ